MASSAKRGRNEPQVVQPIIVKKIVEEAHGAHHGGAWKIAYADFVTAMMAFFLLLWLLGATDEDQRKALADYFTPTLIEYKQNSAGSDGILGGDSIIARDNYPHRATQTGSRAIVIPRDVTGGIMEGVGPNEEERQRFDGWLTALRAVPTIKHLRERIEVIRVAELERALRRAPLSDADPEALDQLTRALVNKILHEPISRLRREAEREEGMAYLEAARVLFGLDESPPTDES